MLLLKDLQPMLLTNLTFPDEGEATERVNAALFKPMPMRRTDGWTAGKPVPVDGLVPVIAVQPGGIYRNLVTLRGLGNLDGAHHLATEDPARENRAIMPVRGFEAEVSTHRHPEARIRVEAANGEMMFVTGTFSYAPGGTRPEHFFPTLVKPGDDLASFSTWAPFLLDLHEAQEWLRPSQERRTLVRRAPYGTLKVKLLETA
ncbi:hypothetical protein [Marinicauda pacifica]|uniref:Uncharacterized protein n=2 Tax=Marinicauda pacifica TaxID=1133559 RepID=A0A4S2H975_9PROT|nr:hypothetical protein [Marinicauda pacifica]TGY92407.1 hypothetical protein E5162_12230 [Marinicauda pacifica]